MKAPPTALSLAHECSCKLSRVLGAPQSSHCPFDVLMREYLPHVRLKLESKSTRTVETVAKSLFDLCQTMTTLSGRLCSVAADMQTSCDRIISLLQQLVDIELQKKRSLVKTLALEAPLSPTVYQAYMAPLMHMHVSPSQHVREKIHEAYTQPPLSTPAT